MLKQMKPKYLTTTEKYPNKGNISQIPLDEGSKVKFIETECGELSYQGRVEYERKCTADWTEINSVM